MKKDIIIDAIKEKIDEFQEIKYYILHMLGSPVIEVELDDNQVTLCIEKATIETLILTHDNNIEDDIKLSLIKWRAAIEATKVLAMVRRKYDIEIEDFLGCKELMDFYKTDLKQWNSTVKHLVGK